MVIKGRSPNLKHVNRTHRTNLDWLFERLREDPAVTGRYIHTKLQIADLLTKGSFTVEAWSGLCRLMRIGPPPKLSSTSDVSKTGGTPGVVSQAYAAEVSTPGGAGEALIKIPDYFTFACPVFADRKVCMHEGVRSNEAKEILLATPAVLVKQSVPEAIREGSTQSEEQQSQSLVSKAPVAERDISLSKNDAEEEASATYQGMNFARDSEEEEE